MLDAEGQTGASSVTCEGGEELAPVVGATPRAGRRGRVVTTVYRDRRPAQPSHAEADVGQALSS
jgi:hypothetical protein